MPLVLRAPGGPWTWQGCCWRVDRDPWIIPVGHPCGLVPAPSVLGCPGLRASPFDSCVASALTTAPGFAQVRPSWGQEVKKAAWRKWLFSVLGRSGRALVEKGAPGAHSRLPARWTPPRSGLLWAPLPSSAVPPTAPLPQPTHPCCDGRVPSRREAPRQGLQQSAWCPWAGLLHMHGICGQA